MTVLSSVDLHRLYPDSPHIQPASLDLHLGDSLLVWPSGITRNPRFDQTHDWQTVPLGERNGAPCWVLQPGKRYLSVTRERLKILPEYAGELTGRSSWGRDGLEVHRTAGWIDPGYEGHPTLELSVVGSWLVIWPGAAVCQLILHRLETPCDRLYAGRYQGDSAPTPSRQNLEVAS